VTPPGEPLKLHEREAFSLSTVAPIADATARTVAFALLVGPEARGCQRVSDVAELSYKPIVDARGSQE